MAPVLASVLALLLALLLPGTAVAQVGFVSLNCGADGSGAFTDQQNGILWVPDQTYVSTGSPGVVSPVALTRELLTVRYFPLYKKNCYSIPVQPTFSYLIRAGFYYGNYDTLTSRTITFSLSLDNTPWQTVNLLYDPAAVAKPTYVEAFTNAATSSTLAVCLIRDGTDVPFINSLEARLIDESNVYTGNRYLAPAQVHLQLLGRTNFGERTATIRYPDDKWDRIWPSYLQEFPELSVLRTLSAPPNVPIVNNDVSSAEQPPRNVMATAIQAPAISYSRLVPAASTIFGAQYYAELNASLAPTDRRYVRWRNNWSSGSFPINITTLVPIYSTLEIVYSSGTNDSVLAFTLDRYPGLSTVDAILNADELYTVNAVVLEHTRQNDVDALSGIKADLDIAQWVSDPCLPVPWDEVNCTIGGIVAINGLDLSRKGFSGPLPANIPDLSELQTLLLNDNVFSGSLWDTFANLTKLQTLNVANNGLNGTLPSWLTGLTYLTQLDLSGNNFSGTIPEALLSNPNLNFSYGGNLLICSSPSCPPSAPPPPLSITPTLQNTPSPPPPETTTKKKNSNSTIVIVAAVIGGIALVAIIAIVAVGVYCCCKRESKQSHSARSAGVLPRVPPAPSALGAPLETIAEPEAEVWEPSSAEHIINASPLSSVRSKGKARQFSLAEIKIATNDFRKQIGAGSFGPVYYGRLTDEKQHVEEIAVKVLSSTSVQGEKEFITEIEFLSMLHHKNLVRIVGFCQHGRERILVYEHMAGGDLGTRLHGPQVGDRGPISWKDRLKIALDAAQGLEYLHHGCKPAIIHRDVKSSNILLSKANEAKVSDFGLSKIMRQEGDMKGDTTIIKAGTVGHEYIDPEFFRTSFVTTESDVYSFGVILFELITGRSPISKHPEVAGQPKPLVQWVHSLVKKADVATMADPFLAQHYDNTSIWGLVEIAVRCTDASRANRPSMAEVVRDLNRLVKRSKR